MRQLLLITILCLSSFMLWGQSPRNLIYVIGDGMGTGHVYSSIVAQGGESNFLRFPFSGFSRTYSLDHYTTDSGAGGSALMTGHKVQNSHISMGPKGEWYSSILTLAQEQGRSAGFVVTVSVLDATPATTYGHVPNRKHKDTLALQMSQCPFEVMIGCDQSRFLSENRRDGLSPIDTLRARGYDVVTTLREMKRSKSPLLCALLTPTDEPGNAEVRGSILKEGVKKALDNLSRNDSGFVLMVEGSQIDWACHNQDAAHLEMEMREFDEVLGDILDWAQADGETLVVVTADHETGGVTLRKGDIQKQQCEITFGTDYHTGVMVPIFSYGPGAEYFSGIHENSDLVDILMKLLKIHK